MKYGKLTLGEMEAIVNKLGGMAGVMRLLSGESVIKKRKCRFKVWKTIELGTGLKTAKDFRLALKDGKFRIDNFVSKILGTPAFTVATEKTKIDLVKVTVAELGFKKDIGGDQIYRRAQELGLELCSSEVGPQLRLQYPDQPCGCGKYDGDTIFVGMETITLPIPGCHPLIFEVYHNDLGMWLVIKSNHPTNIWSPDSQWVFCRPCE